MAWIVNKNQHQDSYQRETVPDKFFLFVFFKIGKAKKSIGWAKDVYVSRVQNSNPVIFSGARTIEDVFL